MSILSTSRQNLGLATPPAPTMPPEPVRVDLNLSMQPQKESEWCWAAVSASVAAFFSDTSPWTQCGIVCEMLAQSACCTDGSSSACNQPYYLDRALRLVKHYKSDFEGRPADSWLDSEISERNPVGVSINWTGGGGHFVAVDGFDTTKGTIDVRDPLFGNAWLAASSFPSTYQGGGTWAWTYETAP